MEYKFRSATEEDLLAIKAINEECMSENYDLDIYQKLIRSTVVCVSPENQIVGYLIMANLATNDKDLEKYSFTLNNKLTHCVLFSTAVLPAHRNKGIASRLVQIIIDSSKKASILLHVRSNNVAALRIYDKFGFKKIKTTPNYYSNPIDDAYLLVYQK